MKWKETIDFSTLPTWEEFTKVLERRCQYLESIDPQESSTNKLSTTNHNKRNGSRHQPQKHTFMTQVKKNCIFCKRLDHWSSNCSQFRSMDSTSRFDTVKKLGACINCLSIGHNIANCTSKYRCKTCNLAHHTLLHRETPAVSTNSTVLSNPVNQAAVNTHMNNKSSSIILATAIILVSDSTGGKISIDVSGVGGQASNMKYEVSSTVRSRFNSHESSLNLLITNRISGYLPSKNIDVSGWDFPQIDMADEFFYKQQPIDLLLGTEYFFDVLCSGKISLGENMPTFQETKVGWIVTGRYTPNTKQSIAKCMVSYSEPNDLDEQIKFLWQMEEVSPPANKWTAEQQLCESHFVSNVETNSQGRIVVKLPFKEHFSALGSSYNTALKRFHLLERRLTRDTNLKTQYMQFMYEYEQMGHMSLISNPNINTPHYFTPHHCVLRPNSTSTKLRVVFDASAVTSTEKSLNDILLVGPTIQDELFLQVLRFRLYKYALTGDITKMYRMFLVHESDRPFQQILWRSSETQPVSVYQLNTITYGMSASPFLAIRSLHFLADKFEGSHQTGATIIRNHFYVDDMITGANTIDELIKIKNEVVYILSKGGLELAKIQSNHPDFLSDDISPKNMNMEKLQIRSALGISWDAVKDNFLFAAPHFGGLWEAAVKSAKGHLYRTLVGAKLTFEEVTTALIEVEAIMNSRPIAALSSDPNDIEALTPGHFLVNGPLNSLPERTIQCEDISFLERWRRISAAKQQFWHCWSEDYLNEMIQRKKWFKTASNLKPGTLVLIHEDNLAPLHWAMGRIIATIPGKDGKIRVADIKTAKGIIRRPIQKLAILVES
ncbi:uncharacterized protein LOC135955606 [Calliphora vicina]|uniref:uncharacterized protein LOC135955606 n=1 Tax=Calliphora vicina TaxID=7373 RepID=UPI00325ABF8E